MVYLQNLQNFNIEHLNEYGRSYEQRIKVIQIEGVITEPKEDTGADPVARDEAFFPYMSGPLLVIFWIDASVHPPILPQYLETDKFGKVHSFSHFIIEIN